MTKKKAAKVAEAVAEAKGWRYHSEGDFPETGKDIIVDIDGKEVPAKYMSYLFYKRNGMVWAVIEEPVKAWRYADSDK